MSGLFYYSVSDLINQQTLSLFFPHHYFLLCVDPKPKPPLFSAQIRSSRSTIGSLPSCLAKRVSKCQPFTLSLSVHLRAGIVTVNGRVYTVGSVKTPS